MNAPLLPKIEREDDKILNSRMVTQEMGQGKAKTKELEWPSMFINFFTFTNAIVF